MGCRSELSEKFASIDNKVRTPFGLISKMCRGLSKRLHESKVKSEKDRIRASLVNSLTSLASVMKHLSVIDDFNTVIERLEKERRIARRKSGSTSGRMGPGLMDGVRVV